MSVLVETSGNQHLEKVMQKLMFFLEDEMSFPSPVYFQVPMLVFGGTYSNCTVTVRCTVSVGSTSENPRRWLLPIGLQPKHLSWTQRSDTVDDDIVDRTWVDGESLHKRSIASSCFQVICSPQIGEEFVVDIQLTNIFFNIVSDR